MALVSIDWYQIVDRVEEEDAEGQEDERGQRAFVDAAFRRRRHRRFRRVVHVRLVEPSDESGDLIQIQMNTKCNFGREIFLACLIMTSRILGFFDSHALLNNFESFFTIKKTDSCTVFETIKDTLGVKFSGHVSNTSLEELLDLTLPYPI